YYTAEGSITTPGDARRSLTVGATNWSDDVLEDYSAQGPTRDGRLKPDLVAPAGVSSAAYGKTWQGTSASTPHVSGAAALVMQAFPNYSPDQVSEFLEARARDLGPGGPDNAAGFGRLALGAPPPLLDPLQITATAAAPTQPAPPQATATPIASGGPTATPERVILATPTQTAGESAGGGRLLTLALVCCVVLPGLVGLGGLGLLGVLWSARRSAPRPRRPTAHAEPHRPAQPGDRGPADRAAYVRPDTIPGGPLDPSPSLTPTLLDPPVRPRESGGDCPRCSTPYRAGARFCTHCGLTLDLEAAPQEEQAFCTRCGQRLRTSSKFCPRCGHARA
ncbi:MAG: S8 family serine peptidase, partial [Chloroflexota bacterium]